MLTRKSERETDCFPQIKLEYIYKDVPYKCPVLCGTAVLSPSSAESLVEFDDRQ